MKIVGWIIALPVIAFVLFALARFTLCGPDKEVVKVATPMVQGIADYIVEHGVPESLDQISDLPYKLEGCQRKIRHRELVGVSYKDTKIKKNANFSIVEESCSFIYNQDRYEVSLWFSNQYKYPERTHGNLSIGLSKTSVGTSFVYQNNKLTYDGIREGFDNRFGFCRPFKR